MATRYVIRAPKQEVSEVNSTRRLEQRPSQNQVFKTQDPAQFLRGNAALDQYVLARCHKLTL